MTQTLPERIQQAFVSYDPEYVRNKSLAEAALVLPEKELLALQAKGYSMACSIQRNIEAKWLMDYQADWPAFTRSVATLVKSLTNTDQDFALEQSPVDGSWGPCYTQWFLQLDTTIDAFNLLADADKAPDYPVDFLVPHIGTPAVMSATLDGLLVSNIAETGNNKRNALGGVSTFLSEICFKHLRKWVEADVRGFTLTQELIDAYRAWQDTWQDPETGYWGAWFQFGDDLVKSTDLSFVYHTVAYRKGDVNYWPQLIDTTFAIRNDPYPFGWLHNGAYNNHNNYDLVRIFRYGWPHMTKTQQALTSATIGDMLTWCLTKSMTPDGGFIADPTFYNSLGDAYYYGVSFLNQAGYWDKSMRFWTSQDFPDAPATCCKILKNMTEKQIKGASADEARAILMQYCPECG